jgi:tetratricopeptide (TPR) repeat protein
VAQAHLADLQDKMGDARAAAESYKRGLLLDAKNGDPQSEGVDWFNYGQFLRRRGLPDELAYACLLRAEDLLASANAEGPTLETVLTARKQVESRLGKKAAGAQTRQGGIARARDEFAAHLVLRISECKGGISTAEAATPQRFASYNPQRRPPALQCVQGKKAAATKPSLSARQETWRALFDAWCECRAEGRGATLKP